MLTGRRAPEDEGRTTGSPAADRVIGPCLARNPELRTPRMQKVLMELKLLSAAVRRAEATRREPAVNATAMRAEMQQLESRIGARLAAHEQAVAEMQRSATEAVTTLKDQLLALGSELAAAQQRIAARPEAEDVAERILARVDRGFDAVSEHIRRVEQTVEESKQHAGQFERSVAADLVDLEQNLKSQGGAIESARTAMAQTDDLVERVVEALEALQTAVLDQGEGPGDRTNFAIN
jgi:chromosome segregation ATPase